VFSDPDFLFKADVLATRSTVCNGLGIRYLEFKVNQGHQSLLCVASPLESASCFIPSTSSCSLFSWFTSSCAYHFVTLSVLLLSSITLSVFHSNLKPICCTNLFLCRPSLLTPPGLPFTELDFDRKNC